MSMKLGSQTGSLVNHVLSRMVKGQPAAAIGMGVTFLSWTDRSAGTIFRVWSLGAFRYIECRSDDYKRIDKNGMSECQDYEFKINVKGGRSYYRQKVGDDSNEWVGCRMNEAGRWVNSRGAGLRIGERDHYHDFSF